VYLVDPPATIYMMKRIVKIGWWLSLLLLFVMPGWRAHAASRVHGQSGPDLPGTHQVPKGFHLVMQDESVQLFRKSYSNGTPDYVEVIRLDQGAAIRVLHGDISEPRTGKGVYGGDDPRFLSHTIQQFWSEFSLAESKAFCVTNGEFFYMKEYPTRLPFPLKVNGNVISDGYGIKQFTDKKLMLEIWSDHAQITPLSQEALYNSSAPDIVAGLAEDAPKNIKKYVGRTFVGVVDQDGNGESETVFLFNTRTARQIDAANVLRSFGADQVMMLDGGGSTQLICQGDPLITTDRYIPQALGILAAAPENDIIQALSVPNLLEKFKSTADQLSKSTPTANGLVEPTKSHPARSGPQADTQPGAVQTSRGGELSDMIWVPISIPPMAAILLVLVAKLRRNYNEDVVDVEEHN
jgi:hypothetical protein